MINPIYLNGEKISGGINYYLSPECYSTEEREVGCWVDGKPLYQKTIHITSLPSQTGTWQTYDHNISNIDDVVGYKGFIDMGDAWGIIPYATVDDSGTICISATATKLRILVGTNRSTVGAYITLYYTKTTDTAGNGIWTPSGIPAVHYSTDEQIIGTYFGDTLYQKTIVLSSGVTIADSWTTIYTDALIGNIAQLVDVKYNNVDNKGVYGVLNYKPNGNNLQAVQPNRDGLTVLAGARFTLQYTKTS